MLSLGVHGLVLELARGVGRDWHTWSRDARELEALRRETGERIEKLRAGAG
jgi:hypothetical protein